MRPNLPFFLAASNAILKPGGLLKWKKWLVKDARLSLQLTKVIKTVRLTSPLPDVLCLSLPRPRLRHSRQFALLSRPNLTLNRFTLSFVLLLAFLCLPPLPTSPTVSLPGNQLRSSPITSGHTFLSPSQRLCVAEPEATFRSSTVPRALKSLICPFALPVPSRRISCGCLKPLLVHCHWPRQSFLSHVKAPFSLWHGFSSSYF